MKKIILILLILVIISTVYILNKMEIPLLNTTITKNNFLTISRKISESNLNDEMKTKIIWNMITLQEKCLGRKVKELL